MGNAMPVVSLFRGDFLYNLVVIEDTDTVAAVAAKCAEHSVGRRVARQENPLQVESSGKILDATASASVAGIAPMDELIVSYMSA